MGLPEIDTALFFFINKGLQNSFFDVAMPFVTNNAKLLFLPLVIWTFLREGKKAWQFLAIALTALALADGSGNILKDLFARQRPCSALENINLLVGCGGSFSMPSNHASNAFGFAMVYWFLGKNVLRPFFVLVAAAVGFSRIYVGVHYPFDVLAGSLLGIAASYGAIRFYRLAARIYEKRSHEQALYLALFVLSLFRIYYILTTPVDLSADEAHYWEWSRRLDLSYYSKGPMIAYIIRLGTLVFGDTVFGIRIFAVLFSALSSLMMYKLGKGLYDEKTGLFSALLLQIVPLYSIFGVLLTIDSPFIFFWILALFLFYKADKASVEVLECGSAEDRKQREKAALIYWILVGAVVGLGLLTKYTMAFFYVSALLFMLINRDARRHLSSKGPYMAFAVSLLFFAPVLVWNAKKDWVTFRHTAGQAHIADGLTLAPKYFFEFIGSQFGVVTPVLFVLVIIALWRLRKDRGGAFLFWFSVPVILFFVMKSIQGKVQANWALTGYAGGFIAFSAYYLRNIGSAGKLVKSLVSAGLVLSFAVTAVAHYPAVLNLRQQIDPTSKLVFWKELGQEVTGIYSDMSPSGPLFIFSDAYQISSELAFYVKGRPFTYCINLGRRMNQYDLWPGFEKLTGYNAIFVTYETPEIPGAVAEAFARHEKITLELKTKKNKTMKFTVFKCYDFRGIKSRPAETY